MRSVYTLMRYLTTEIALLVKNARKTHNMFNSRVFQNDLSIQRFIEKTTLGHKLIYDSFVILLKFYWSSSWQLASACTNSSNFTSIPNSYDELHFNIFMSIQTNTKVCFFIILSTLFDLSTEQEHSRFLITVHISGDAVDRRFSQELI